MIIRRLSRRLRPLSERFVPGQQRCYNPALQQNHARLQSTSSIPVTTSISPIIPKYPDPVFFNPSKLPPVNTVANVPQGIIQTTTVPSHINDPSVPLTLYSFPSFAPLQLLHYPATHLHLPLRRDLLHRAITFEGDAAHQWTRWTPHRKDHPGSGRKLMPQKGQGRARVGDASSPIRVKGIKTFGPKPRDMSTGLPKKIYDRAWRTALSLRYRKGELVVVDKIFYGEMSRLDKINVARFVATFNGNDVGSGASFWTDKKVDDRKPTRTTWVLATGSEKRDRFREAMEIWWPNDKVRNSETVDVKHLLEGQRIVIEKEALDEILRQHQADLPKRVDWHAHKSTIEADAQLMQAAVEETRKLQEEQDAAARETLKILRSK